MQKQNCKDQVPESDVMLNLPNIQGKFPIRGSNKQHDVVQSSEDDVSESLQSQEMFITQREPKVKDRISDSDDLFNTDEEIFSKSEYQVSYSNSHPREDRTPKSTKIGRFSNRQVRKKLFLGKMKNFQEKIRVGSAQVTFPQETKSNTQLELIDELFIPSQSQRWDTQTFNVSGGDQEPILQDLISPSVEEDESNQECYKKTNSKEMRATASSQTELTFEHIQSQKVFDDCMDCEYLLLTAETLMLLVRIMYDNSKLRSRKLSLDETTPDILQRCKKNVTGSSSQRRSTPKNISSSFLKEIRLLKEDLDNKLKSRDNDMEDSGYLEDGEEDACRQCHLDLQSDQKSEGTEDSERKKRKFEDIEAKKFKKKRKHETEKLAGSQKKKEKVKRNIKKEPLEDIPLENLPCPHELKHQLKKKNGENFEVGSNKSKSKKPCRRRKYLKAAMCDAVSASECDDSYEETKTLEGGFSKSKKKLKRGGWTSGRVKSDQQCNILKCCCIPGNVNLKYGRSGKTKQKRQKKKKRNV